MFEGLDGVVTWFGIICIIFCYTAWFYFKKKYKLLTEDFMYRIHAKKMQAHNTINEYRTKIIASKNKTEIKNLKLTIKYELEYIGALTYAYNKLIKIAKDGNDEH